MQHALNKLTFVRLKKRQKKTTKTSFSSPYLHPTKSGHEVVNLLVFRVLASASMYDVNKRSFHIVSTSDISNLSVSYIYQ